jgi:hypothetical protein
MPSATTRWLRGQAVHHGRGRSGHAASQPAAHALSIMQRATSPQQSNAAHHAPRGPVILHERQRVRGRVHAVVRRNWYSKIILSDLAHLDAGARIQVAADEESATSRLV